MRPRFIIIALWIALAALAATAVHQARLLRERRTALPLDLVRIRNASNIVTRVAVRNLIVTNPAPVGRFDWSGLESTNYFTYITNLRAVRCPEETIREIIMADVGKLYAIRRAALRPQASAPKFWKSGDGWDLGWQSDLEVQRQLRALDREEKALLKELLGLDYESEQAKVLGQDDWQERAYGFLPQAKRAEVMNLCSRFEALEQELIARTRGLMTEEEQAQLRQWQREREAELARVLTPRELDEFNLRNSDTANNLRSNLGAFDATEEEFRRIYRLQKEVDDRFGSDFDLNDRQQADEYAKAQDKFREELRRTLGDARYREYERAQDADYRTLVQVTERFGIGRDAANQVYEIQRALDSQRQRIFGDPALSSDQRQLAYNSRLQEAERSVVQILGERALQLYRRNGAAWLGSGNLPEDLPFQPSVPLDARRPNP